MYCPRLDHFVRLNQNGSVGKCGHMINAKGFDSLEELELYIAISGNIVVAGDVQGALDVLDHVGEPIEAFKSSVARDGHVSANVRGAADEPHAEDCLR